MRFDRSFFRPLVVIVSLFFARASPGEDLAGHWPRVGDQQVAHFDGNTVVELPLDAPHRSLGQFTISLWVRTGVDDDMPGDLVSCRDAEGRGFSLSLVTRSGVTHSQSNFRQLIFELSEGEDAVVWEDRGCPGRAIYAQSLAVHNNALYAGVCQPGVGEHGEVYRWGGERVWESTGFPDLANSVASLASFGDKLIAGSGCYRLAGSSLVESNNTTPGGSLYSLEEDGSWKQIGQIEGIDSIGGMVVYRERLYVSSLYKPARLISLDAEYQSREETLPEPDRRVESMTVFEGKLYATSYDNGHVYRFDGESWEDCGPVGENTQCYGFAIASNRLHVSSWPSGRVYRFAEMNRWDDLGRLGEELEVMGLAFFNGRLYGGTLPSAEVYRLGSQGWENTGQLDKTPDVKYRRAWTMAVKDGQLFVGTLPSGNVWSMRSGDCVSYDRTFAEGWHHVAATCDDQAIALVVDGVEVARSTVPRTTRLGIPANVPLNVGKGSNVPFHGEMKHLRIHRRALKSAEILALMKSDNDS